MFQEKGPKAMKLRKTLAIILSSALAATCIPHGVMAMDNAAELVSFEEETTEKEQDIDEEPVVTETEDAVEIVEKVDEPIKADTKEESTQEEELSEDKPASDVEIDDSEPASEEKKDEMADDVADIETEEKATESAAESEENHVQEELIVELLEMPSEQADYIEESYGDRVLDMYDICVPEDTEFPITISFDAFVTEDQEVMLYHFTGSEWEEIIPDEVNDGMITATFGSLSPVAVIDMTEDFTEYSFTYAVKVGCEEMGSVSAESDVVVSLEDAQVITAESAENYDFTGWFILDENGEYSLVSEDAEFTPYELSDTTFYAAFERGYEDQELSVEADGHKITALGYMPKGAVLSAEKINYTESYEELINEETGETDTKFVVYDAFDITITVDGDVWQPIDDETSVKIEISGIEIPEENNTETADIQVHRIADDESEVTKLEATVEKDIITFETEHFTVFTIGSNTYDSVNATDSWDLSKDQDGSIMAYFFEDENKLIISGSGQMKNFGFSSPFSSAVSNKDVTVEWVDADGITNIGGGLFHNKKCTITNLPNGITSIGQYTFRNCDNCVITEIPESVEAIGNNAFCGTGITTLTIHGNCKTIGTWAFQTCYLESLTLEEGIETIGDSAFNANRSEGWLGMTELVIPDSVTTISNGAFGYNRGITKISGGNGITSLGTNVFVVSQGSTTVNTTLITDNDILKDYDWVGDKRVVSIPKIITIDGTDYDVTNAVSWDISYAGNGALMAYYLEDDNLLIISGTGSMKTYVYNNTYGGEQSPIKDLSGYTVLWDDHGIASIGDYFFAAYTYGEDNTMTIESLPDGLMTIGQHAFSNCVNFNLDIPSSVKSIGLYAFADCSSLAIDHLPDGLTNLGSQAFTRCDSITSMTLPTNITTVPYMLFQHCQNLETLTLANGTTKIDGWAFSYCENLRSVNNMAQIQVIGERAFSGCISLQISEFPATLTSLGAYAYSGCTSIIEMDLSSVTGLSSIPTGVFSGCTGLENVIFQANITSIGDSSFRNCTNLALTSLPDSLTSIGNSAFYSCEALALTSFPDGLTSIDEYAFNSCNSLTQVDLSNCTALTNIGSNAFQHCKNLKKISLSGLTTVTVGDDAFAYCGTNNEGELVIDLSGCTGIADLSIIRSSYTAKSIDISGTSITTIPNSIFGYNWFWLERIELPDGLQSIGDHSFYNCTALTEINFEELTALEEIGPNAFAQCYCFETINLSNCASLTIGQKAFEDEYRLTSLTLPAGITVGSQAFADCYNLSEIVATGTGTIAEDSFGLMGYINSDMNPHTNYFLDDSYHSVVLPVKTTLTGDADWFDTHDFKANRRLVGDYTITLPMSIDLTYDGTGSWDIGYEVENNTNNWPVTVRPRDTNNVSVGYLMLRSDDNSNLKLSFPTTWFDGTSYDTGDNEGTITLSTNQTLTQEKTYTGSLTFQAGIYVD